MCGKINVGPGEEHASNNLFCKTTGREDGPLKEDWGRELQKLTDRQPRSKNYCDFETKLRFINSFPHVLLKPTCVSITWTLIFELFQKPGDWEICTKKQETPRKNRRVGMSVTKWFKALTRSSKVPSLSPLLAGHIGVNSLLASLSASWGF